MAVGDGRLDTTVQLGDRLLANTAVSGREAIRQQLATARLTWNQLSKDIAEHCRRCQECDDVVRMFTDSLAHLNAWLDEAENRHSVAEKCSVGTPEQCKDHLTTLQVRGTDRYTHSC